MKMLQQPSIAYFLRIGLIMLFCGLSVYFSLSLLFETWNQYSGEFYDQLYVVEQLMDNPGTLFKP